MRGHGLDDLILRGQAMLPVEEVAERRVRLQLHRRRALWFDIGPRFVPLKRGLRDRAVRPQRSLDDRHLLAEDVEVHRRVGRRERPDGGVIGTVGKHPHGRHEKVSRRDARVEARERAERLRHALIGFGPAGQIADGVTHLPRLLAKDAPLDQRPAHLEPRTVPVEPKTTVVRAAHARPEAVGVELPLISGATRLDDDKS